MTIFGFKSRIVTQFLFVVILAAGAYFHDHRFVVMFCSFAAGVCFAGGVEDLKRWRRRQP